MGQPGPLRTLTIKQFCDSQGEVIFFFSVPIEKRHRKANIPIPSTKGYSLKAYYFEGIKSKKRIHYWMRNVDKMFENQFLKQYMTKVRGDTRSAKKLTNYRKLAAYLETRAYQHANDTILKIPDPNNSRTDIAVKDLYTYLLTKNMQSLVFTYEYFFTLLLKFKNKNTKEVMYLLVKNIYLNQIDKVCFQPGYYEIDAGETKNITPFDWKKIRKK